MANQIVTTVVNYDNAAISGLLNDETITVDGGSVTIDEDVRWNQQASACRCQIFMRYVIL
jgi:hypothetical protein